MSNMAFMAVVPCCFVALTLDSCGFGGLRREVKSGIIGATMKRRSSGTLLFATLLSPSQLIRLAT